MYVKRKGAAVALVFALSLLLVYVTPVVKEGKANFFPFEPTNPIIIIESPTNSTYNVTSLTLNVTIKTMKTLFEDTNPEQLPNATRLVTYTLDGEKPKVITEISYNPNVTVGSSVIFTGIAVLPELTEGPHNVTVHAEYDYNPYDIHRESESSVYFIIDTTPPFPTTVVATSMITVALISTGLLVYFKKRNHKTKP
jgi:hypothetical protein